jgi:hypothetical protein
LIDGGLEERICLGLLALALGFRVKPPKRMVGTPLPVPVFPGAEVVGNGGNVSGGTVSGTDVTGTDGVSVDVHCPLLPQVKVGV